MDLLYRYIFYFFIYGFLGWICETIYCSIGNKKVINRGFLNGPICPIYGLGALMVILLLNNYRGNLAIIFIMGLVMTSILEYITGYILEFLFHTTWWDYSNRMFNINGRVCLKNSILFGILSIFLIEIIHPTIVKAAYSLNTTFVYVLVIILTTYLITDISITVNAINKLRYKLDRIEEAIECFKNINIQIKLEKLTEKSEIQHRLLNAFPNMNHKYKNEGLKYLKQMLKDKNK